MEITILQSNTVLLSLSLFSLLIFGTYSLEAAPSLVNAQPFNLADLTLGAYTYNYHSELAIDHDDISSPSHAFQFDAIVQFQDVFYDANNRLIRIYLDEPKFKPGNRHSEHHYTNHATNLHGTDAAKPNYKGGDFFDSYAHVVIRSNGTSYVKQFYSKQSDFITYKNIKKSIVLNLIPTDLHSASKESQAKYFDNNFLSQPELFSPDTYSQISLNARLSEGRSSIFQQVDAYQNVTFKSRVYSSASSLLQTQINLKLTQSDNTLISNQKEIFSQAQSIDKAIALLLPHGYYPESAALQRVTKICSHHHCDKSLNALFQDYRDSLTTASLATVDAAVAYLKVLARLREHDGTSLSDITNILKKLKSSANSRGALDSFLDILAAARTKDSILAALKYLKLPKNKNLDMAERFLSALSVSANTAAKMHLNRPLQSPYHFVPTPALIKSSMVKTAPKAPIAFIANEILNLVREKPTEEWTSQKLRWSTLLTLSSLVQAHNQESNFAKLDDELNQQVESLLIKELGECSHSETDCRIVVIQAIGNIGNLNEANFRLLEDQILNSGRRESIAAMKALKDCLQNCAAGKHLSLSFYKNIKDLLIRVVYDDLQETTARVLASELIVRFIPDSLASDQLIGHLPSFGNNELATMIYSRVMSLRPDSKSANAGNWYWKSCIINGSSASFVKTMAETPSVNASYGVNVELTGKKILKESSFDVMLDTNQRRQDLFSLGIFARGLQDMDDDESWTAGMTLRLLGGYLRPYIFFTSKMELMGHVFNGRGSDPLTAFSGDLLLIDHQEGYPLISGFVAEQQMRGVLSIEVTGTIKVSLWYGTSESLVRTKASVIVQSSQSVFTGHENIWSSHLYSFGGHAVVDFNSDLRNFHSTPEFCLQVVQPEFKFRHNSRRHEQLLSDQIQRKFSGKVQRISAKSYSLNKENNEMCSRVFMTDEL